MRPVALLLAVAVALSASPAVAEENAPHQRGFLTGLGLGFLLLGGVGTGLGVSGSINAGQADAALEPLVDDAGNTKQQEDTPLTTVLGTQRASGTVLAIVGFTLAAASFITSIVLFVIDRPRPPVTVAFMPTQQGGTFALTANF